MGCLQEISIDMAIEWKERGPEAKDNQASQSVECVSALRDWKLLKFFRTRGLKAQNELLQYLIGLWDVDQQIFIIGDQELEIEVVDI